MFRFTIRDVLWLTALVAMATEWGVDHWRGRIEMHRAGKQVAHAK